MKPCAFVCAIVAASALWCATSRAAAPHAAVVIDETRMSQLLEQLDDDDFEVRQAADLQLRELGKAAMPRLLAERLTTPSLEVIHRIDKMLKALTPPERLATWAQLLSHPDARCRDQADHTLRQECPQALPALLKLRHGLDARSRARLEKLIDELADAAY